MVTVPHFGGASDMDRIAEAVNDRTAALVMAHPNFFGVLEDLRPAADLAHSSGALLVAFTEPAILGVIEPPGIMGADVVVAEGCSLGLTPFAGGDALGLFACRQEYLRKIPGRLVGMTKDADGRTAYTLTLQTREQHIRRERATSNICTNQGLHALRAAVHLICLGPQGLREIGLAALAAARAAREAAVDVEGFEIAFEDRPAAQSFVLRCAGVGTPARPGDGDASDAPSEIGLPLDRWFPDLKSHFLVTAGELTTPEQIQRWRRALAAAAPAEALR
jgi:glycine dehydrogenase subunit 1